MAVYLRKLSKGHRWFYKFDLNGKTYKSRAIFQSKAEAKKAEADAYQEADYRQRHPKEIEDITLHEAINQRLDYVKSRKSNSYYNDNRRYLRILFERVGDIVLNNITKNIIEDILLEASQRLGIDRTGNHTVNAMIRCYNALFNFSGDYNPCKKIEFYPIDKKLKFIPSNKQIEEVLKMCTVEQKSLISFILETGARISEALALKGEDILKNAVTLYTRKSNNSDLVPRKVLKPESLKDRGFLPKELIFCQWKKQPKFLQRKIKFLKQPPWGFHSLRHRRASLWSQEGKPLFEIMSLLGHSSLTTTQIYLQMLPDLGDDLGTETMENK